MEDGKRLTRRHEETYNLIEYKSPLVSDSRIRLDAVAEVHRLIRHTAIIVLLAAPRNVHVFVLDENEKILMNSLLNFLIVDLTHYNRE